MIGDQADVVAQSLNPAGVLGELSGRGVAATPAPKRNGWDIGHLVCSAVLPARSRRLRTLAPVVSSPPATDLRSEESDTSIAPVQIAGGRAPVRQAEPSQRDAQLRPKLGPTSSVRDHATLSADAQDRRSHAQQNARTRVRRSGGQGVASSNLASPTDNVGLSHLIRPRSSGRRREHSPTVALVDQGPAPPGQAARVLASLRAAPLTPKTYCFASSRTLIRD